MPPVAATKKVLAKVVQLYSGLDLIGSVMSVHARNAELEVIHHGIRMVSKKNKRVIVIPWANIKGYEEIQEAKEE